ALLLAYWALSLPSLGAALVELARQAPGQRNVLLRLLEPLGADDEAAVAPTAPAPALASGQRGVELALRDVALVLGGHVVLEQVNLEVRRGEHLAVVGRSGAGKSSLAGLLLGWHRATRGQVEVDGVPLQGEHLAALRTRTAWVEPGVQLWNRTLAENIEYGAPPDRPPLAEVLAAAELAAVVESLPQGLDSTLGEGGGLVSGGEGQRVRLARALMRRDADLVVLDEPFRGLGHGQRQALLARCRERWRDATLICITHDVEDTLAFSRVVVVDDGTVAEDGAPAALEQADGSRYRALLDGARAAARLWGEGWRHLTLRERRLVESEESGR
ncbi:MAG: ABC transporter ATP-binding protein/permease, partial [Myxococcaceae bacterium]|nr:ABC transporter ATP-binding protein/permease [Myxococcaceae bacterium]